MSKITFLLYTSPRKLGGGMKVIYEYGNYLASKGHQVEFAYMGNALWSRYPVPEPLRKLLARISVMHRPTWFALDKRIKKYVVFSVSDRQIHDADTLVATHILTAQPAASLNASKGEKAYFIQDFENWSLPDHEVYKTYALEMKNITVAKWLSDVVDAHAAKPSVCVPNGINTCVFRVVTPINERPPHTIAFHYRENPIKGCEFALETIRILQRKYSDLKVTVVSTEPAPDNLPSCCKYVQNALPEEVAAINNETAIFMCSSVLEGYGLPGLEAMACGCALVSTDYPAIHEYAVDGETALLSPVRDAESMARNIERLFEDNDLRIRLGMTAAESAAKRSVENSAALFERALLADD